MVQNNNKIEKLLVLLRGDIKSLNSKLSNKNVEIKVNSDDIKSAFKNISLPTPTLRIPPIQIPKIDPPKIPEIKIPKPNVNIETKTPNVEMPDKIKINGFTDFIKNLFKILKGEVQVKISGVDKKNPLPVVLTSKDGFFYNAVQKIAGASSGASMVGLKDSDNKQVEPADKSSQTDIKNEISKQIVTDITEDEVTLTNKGDVYSKDLPDHTKSLLFHLQSRNYPLYYSFNNTNWRVIPTGATFSKSGLDFTDKTIYLKCEDSAGENVEIEIWT